MYKVPLPMVRTNTKLADALTAMRRMRKSAIIAQHGEVFWLYTSGHIVRGLAKKKKALAELERKVLVQRKKPSATQLSQRRVPKSSQTLYVFGYSAERVTDACTVVASARSTATLTTNLRGLAMAIRHLPRDCYCTGKEQHSVFPHKVSTGDKCPYCNYEIYCE